MPGLGELIVILMIFPAIGIWVWMLVDCAQHEDDKVLWLIIIAVFGILGALIYLFARRTRRGRLAT